MVYKRTLGIRLSGEHEDLVKRDIYSETLSLS